MNTLYAVAPRLSKGVCLTKQINKFTHDLCPLI